MHQSILQQVPNTRRRSTSFSKFVFWLSFCTLRWLPCAPDEVMADEEPTEEPSEEPQVDDPEVEEVALRFDEMPADLVGVKKGVKKGAKKGRKAGATGTIVEPRTFYASINRNDGTARLFNDNKVGRVAVVQTNYQSPPKAGQEMMHCVVCYTDDTYRLFRVWENIMHISRRLDKRIKSLYTVIG
eukprot:g28646.t1